MKVITVENYDEMSRVAADMIAEIVTANPDATLGLATGSTPIGCYKLLADFCASKKVSFAHVKAVNLDEYVGLPATHSQSYAYFMRRNLFDHIDIDLGNTAIPNGCADDVEEECANYCGLVERLPRDVQVLGLGSNGHIGFNEPNTPFDCSTHLVELTASTVKDNSRLFDDPNEVPKKAITMGIAEIMQARKIILLASGANKAQAVYNLVKGNVTESCPASILQRHPDCVAIVDKEAGRLLPNE